MSETQTITETEPQAGLPASVPDATDTLTGGDQTDTHEPEAPAPEPEPQERPWYEKVIAAKAHEAREAKRQVADLQARLQSQQPTPQQGQQPAGYVPVSQVQQVAAEIAAAEKFNDACNAVADAGEAKYADFNTATRNWGLLGGPPRPLLEAVAELGTDQGARVYYELGKNPERAEKLIAMSPTKMMLEVAKLAASPAAAVSVTKAPDPIRPPSAGRVANNNPDAMTDEEQRAWFKKNYNPYKRRS